MLIIYKIYYPDLYWGCTVQIDEDFVIEKFSKPGEPFTTKDAIKEMVEFWGWWEDRLDMNDGNYTKTFLQQFGRFAITDIISNNHNTYGVISSIEEAEGWYNMDGTMGMKVIAVEDLEFSESDFQVFNEAGEEI